MHLEHDDLTDIAQTILAPAVADLMDALDEGDDVAAELLARHIEDTAQAIRFRQVATVP